MKEILVYVAGPVSAYGASHHDAVRVQTQNVERGIDVGMEVLVAGFYPFIPHLTHYFHLRAPEDYGALYYEWDNVVLRRCDVLLKFASSRGADAEEELAKSLGIPVVYSVEELKELYR